MNKVPLPACFNVKHHCDTAMEAMAYRSGKPLLFSASCTPKACMEPTVHYITRK
jgi:hypothetical protein